MSEVWLSSSLPTKTSIFNWKIDNFGAQVLKLVEEPGYPGFDSSDFQVESPDGKLHSLKLRLLCLNNDCFKFEEAGKVKLPSEFTLVKVMVVNNAAKDNFKLAGMLTMNIEGAKLFGEFGNASGNCWIFKNPNKVRTQMRHYEPWQDYCTDYFCLTNSAKTLVLRVQLIVPVGNSHLAMEKESARMLTDFKSLLQKSNNYYDFTISCEGEDFPCHEAVLRARSTVLDRMFEQKMREVSTRKMTVDDVSKSTMEEVLEFIYTGHISKDVVSMAELIYMGDKYSLPGLLELCIHKFPEVKDEKVVDILIQADKHNLRDLKVVALQRILMNKSKFVNEELMEKMYSIPGLLMELLKS